MAQRFGSTEFPKDFFGIHTRELDRDLEGFFREGPEGISINWSNASFADRLMGSFFGRMFGFSKHLSFLYKTHIIN